MNKRMGAMGTGLGKKRKGRDGEGRGGEGRAGVAPRAAK